MFRLLVTVSRNLQELVTLS